MVGHDVAFVERFLSSTVPMSRGCMPYEGWVERTRYGRRWKIGCTFSDFKRLMGECVDATSADGLVRETFFKVLAFNIHESIRASILRIADNGVAVGLCNRVRLEIQPIYPKLHF